MPEEMDAGCARPTGGPVGEAGAQEEETRYDSSEKEVVSMLELGKKVPDFIAPGYHKGKFISLKLSEFLGKWVVLCFYPGDFTFV